MYSLRMLTAFSILAILPSMLFASPADDIDKAAKENKIAFVLVTEGASIDVSNTKAIIQDFTEQNDKSALIELDRKDPANAALVTKFRLATIPVPMILVLNPNGTISGALQPQRATAESLAKMIPSPKKAEIIKALSEGNAVFITAYRKDMKTVESINSACETACRQMAGKSVQVKVDMDDPAEAGFLADMKINMASPEPVTVVANPQGQISATYTGEIQVTQLVASAKKKVSGCCPKTVAKPDASCAPPKK